MSAADAVQEIPTVEEVRNKLGAISDQMKDLTGSGLSKVTTQVRGRPLAMVLVALGIGLVGGYLLKR